jgi:hypothetical protein
VAVTPIFDDLAAHYAAADRRRTAPRPRPTAVIGSDAFGRGCLEAEDPGRIGGGDEVTRLLEGARREAVALGRRWVGTVHLALAAVRAGGDVGRVFGMRGVGPAVLLATLDDDLDAPADEAGGDPVHPALSSVARTVLHRVAHRAAREDRAVSAAELAVAVARSGRVSDLLERRGVDVDDLVDALLAGASAATVRAAADAVEPRPRRIALPVGVVAPVTVMVPTTATPAAPAVVDEPAAVVPA